MATASSVDDATAWLQTIGFAMSPHIYAISDDILRPDNLHGYGACTTKLIS